MADRGRRVGRLAAFPTDRKFKPSVAAISGGDTRHDERSPRFPKHSRPRSLSYLIGRSTSAADFRNTSLGVSELIGEAGDQCCSQSIVPLHRLTTRLWVWICVYIAVKKGRLPTTDAINVGIQKVHDITTDSERCCNAFYLASHYILFSFIADFKASLFPFRYSLCLFSYLEIHASPWENQARGGFIMINRKTFYRRAYIFWHGWNMKRE